MAEQKKIAGILIENVISQNTVKGSIIGVGLNINQTDFEHLPQATSMRLISGRHYNIDEVLHVFIDQLKLEFTRLERRDYKGIKTTYLESLFRKDKPSTFKTAEGNLFSGFILGINDSGRLQIKVEDSIIKTFAFKEVSLLY